ncbi:MAG: S9 family peptidase, partial [Bryobacteraceae bacterium]
MQLYTAEGSGKGTAKKITSVTGFLSSPEWSPDGKRLAFLFTENAPRAAGPTEPMTPASGAVDSKLYEQRIAITDPERRTLQQVSPGDLYVFEYEWSPDGARFALTAAPAPGDDNWFIAQFYTMNANGGPVHSIWKTPMQMAMPRWSPDGKRIAVIAGLMSDEGSTGGEVYSIPAGGGAPTDLAPGRKSSPSSIRWIAPDRIVMTENAGGGTAIVTLNPKTRETETLWRGDESVNAGEGPISLAVDGRTAAGIRSSWAQAPEVWAGPIGEWREITDKNKDAKPFWGVAKNIEWSRDGLHAQGWLLFPADYREGGKYPMVVSVHGGPAGVRKPAWPGRFFDLSVLAGKGYFVFFPNPRGSFGQGEAFTRANVKDFGGGDLRDILAGVDQVVKEYPVDPRRVGVAGWSYGGFMTMWAVTQTGRFRAAVAGAGIANWQSYYGENSIDQWMIPYFGASVYDDPAVYPKSSPIDFVKRVKTPTLMLVGDRDGECPAPQSFELWHALKML